MQTARALGEGYRKHVSWQKDVEKIIKSIDHFSFKRKGVNMSKPELLDFSATWCGPCKMQKPFLDKVKEEFGDQVDVKVIDVDQNQEMAAKYGIQAVPTLIIVKEGEAVKRFTGVTTAGILIEELKKVL